MDQLSPFARYINTNYTPSECELPILNLLISERQATVDALAEKIGQMKAALVSLESEHAAHRQFIDDHTKLLAPIRRMPMDILSIIFSACLEDKEPSSSRQYSLRMSKSHPSVVISHTCAEWRSLALHTPHLWSAVHVRVSGLWDAEYGHARAYAEWSKSVDALAQCFEAWAARSSPCPISLTLETGEIDEELSPKYQRKAEDKYKTLIDALGDTTHRWKVLHCWVYFNPVTKAVVKLFGGTRLQYPLLEEIQLQIDDNRPPRGITVACVRELTTSQMFAAPRLHWLTIVGGIDLDGYWGNIAAARANSPSPLYNSVTHLNFQTSVIGAASRFDSAQALELLKTLPRLITVELRIASHTPSISVARHPILLPHLTSMTIDCKPVAEGFGPSLDMPLLRSLHLNGEVERSMTANGNAELILQYGHQLKELSFPYKSMTRESFGHCLKRVCHLATLKLSGVLDDPDVFLLSQLSLPHICPRLEQLELLEVINSALEGLTEHAFVKLLVSKRHGATFGEQGNQARSDASGAWHKLRRIAVEFDDPQQVDIPGELGRHGIDMNGIEMYIAYGEELLIEEDS